MSGFFVTIAFLWVNSTCSSGEFQVVFKHFQNLENLILNILKEKLHTSRLLSFWNSTMQTAMISKAIIKFWSKFHIQMLWYSFIRHKKFLQTPSQYLPGKQENLSSSASRHINNSLSVYFFLDSELDNGGMKVEVKRDFEKYFVSPKNLRKQAGSAWYLSNLQYKCAEVPIWPISKSKPPIFCCSIFSEECLNPHVWINKMVNGHTVDYHSIPSELISRIHPLIFLWTPQGFISPEYSLNFFCNLYIPPWLQQSFKFMVLRLLENEMNLFILLMPQAKHFSRFLSSPLQAEGNYLFPPNNVFWKSILPSRKGEDYETWKMTKIKLAWVLVTSFDKFHHFCNLYLFGSWFLVP